MKSSNQIQLKVFEKIYNNFNQQTFDEIDQLISIDINISNIINS